MRHKNVAHRGRPGAQAGSFPQGYAQALKQQQAELDMILKEIALEQAERGLERPSGLSSDWL